MADKNERNKKLSGIPNRRDKGFVLLAMGVSVAVLLAMVGLAVDLGRTFIARNEAQAFTDAAVLAAASKLNGTAAGVTAAQAQVTNSVNKWNFATSSFSSVTTEFSVDKVTWTNTATATASPANVKWVRVIAPSNSIALTALRGLNATNPGSIPNSITVAARSIAGVQLATSFGEGVFPFAPLAHDPAGPNFGYTKGDELTLLWPAKTEEDGSKQKMNNLCQSDRNQASLDAITDGTNAERGYIMETSASDLAAAIEDDHMDYTVSLGQAVDRTQGVKTSVVYGSLNERSDQDSMPNQTNYDTYIANHDASPLRRVVIVPIIDGANTAIVLGFAYVFLPPNQPHSPNKAKCATYIGPADAPVGNLANGANTIRLVE